MSARAPRWQDRAEYALARAAERGIAGLPEGWAEAVGRGLGGLVRSPLGIRRAVAEENLRRAFPDASAEWLAETTRGLLRPPGPRDGGDAAPPELSRAEIVRRTDSDGEEVLQDAARRGPRRDPGHRPLRQLGGRRAAVAAALGVPDRGGGEAQRNPLVDARLDETRAPPGDRDHRDARGATRAGPARCSRAGRWWGSWPTRTPAGRGVWVPFFGVPASTHRGPARLRPALRRPARLRQRRCGGCPTAATASRVERSRICRARGDLRPTCVALTPPLARAPGERRPRRDPGAVFLVPQALEDPPADGTSRRGGRY